MEKLAILQDWFSRVWIGGDLAAIGAFFTEEALASGVMPGLELQRDDFAELIPALMRMIVEPRVEIPRWFEGGDWLWVLMRIQAKSAQNLAPIDFTAQISMRFEGNRIAEAYNHFDLIAFLEQVGALPPETMALCLSGEHLD